MSGFFSLPADEQARRLTCLARNALAEWGVTDCEPKLLKYRENAVFEVRTGSGERAAMRVHRQGYHSDESLVSERDWMTMLSAAGIVVPQPIPTQAGDIVVDARGDGVPGVWKVDMLTWVDGRMLGNTGEPLDYDGREPDSLFFEIGRTMGELHNLSTAWPGQNAMIRHAWDRDGFAGDNPLWGRFWELAVLTPEQRELFQRVRIAIAEDLDAYGQTADNYGLIHADLVPENVFLCGDKVHLIDFDDAGFGWHMFEIVTAVFWFAEEPDFERICSKVIEGYRSVRPLRQRDLAALPLFFAARSTTYVGWVHTRQNTETAKELTPLIVEAAESICNEYLQGRLPAGRNEPMFADPENEDAGVAGPGA